MVSITLLYHAVAGGIFDRFHDGAEAHKDSRFWLLWLDMEERENGQKVFPLATLWKIYVQSAESLL